MRVYVGRPWRSHDHRWAWRVGCVLCSVDVRLDTRRWSGIGAHCQDQSQPRGADRKYIYYNKHQVTEISYDRSSLLIVTVSGQSKQW